MRTLFLSLSFLALAACGSSPEPKPEPAADARPGVEGCSACVVKACYMPDTPNRLARVELQFTPTVDGKPVERSWDGATLELKPKTGVAQGIKVKTDTWARTGAIKTSVKEPDMKPAPGGWNDVEATLTLKWKQVGKTTATVLTTAEHGLKVEVSACK